MSGILGYQEFLAHKAIVAPSTGLTTIPELNPALFPFQRDCVTWALKRGRAALFEGCGLGKTLQQLEWARHIPGDVLILAPLAVASQTVKESYWKQACANLTQAKISMGGLFDAVGGDA